MQKKLIIGGLVLATVFVGGALYFSTVYHVISVPTSQVIPTSSVSTVTPTPSALPPIRSASVFLNEAKATYISKTFGITFLYPKSLLISENGKGILITPLEQNDIRNESDLGVMAAMEMRVRSESSIEQVEQAYEADKISSHQTTIAGKTAIYILNKDLFAGGVDTTYIFTINSHIFSATYYDTDYTPIYKAILNSLSDTN